MRRMKPSIPAFLGAVLLGAAMSLPAALSQAATRTVDLSRLALRNTRALHRVDPKLLKARGSVDVIVQLAGTPLALANGENARRAGGLMSRAQQIAHSQAIRRNQDEVLAQVLALGGTEIARVRIAYNAAIVRIDASKLAQVAALPGVSTVQRVNDYRVDLSETVPYIGASAAQQVGLDGNGVTVAVLDSGIDYTHRNLGGPGTVAAYEAAYGTSSSDPRNTTLDGLFPTTKVIGGYDFVGEAWDGSATSPPLAPDPDPIDFGAHGTHVADIIAGKSADGTHVGVAPGASLLAVKVCSAVSTACSGVALLEGIDFALDPNGDGSMDDAVDVINMSLGALYGQREDSTSAAAENAARAGVVVVTAAGNSGDKPYILDSPSEAPDVISVAQTQVPSATAIPLVVNSPAAIAGTYGNTATIDWAPIGAGVTGDVVYVGRGCAVEDPTLDEPIPPGGDPYLADPSGKIALIRRGDCNISEKVRRASDAGAIGVLIGLVAPGDAVSFSNGGQCPTPPDGTCKPTLVIQQTLSLSIQANAGVNATISESNGILLIGSMASTSSRGPSFDRNQIKPDIGAPGASVSAIAGTGTGEEAFGGTSGATPMVSGSAAILVQAHPSRAPWQIKSLLMNTAETEVFINPATQPGVLAPITRIGGGEVRVDQALASTTAAWDAQRRTGSLSFGFHNVSAPTVLVRRVTVANYGRSARLYAISNEFRYANDATGAVQLLLPASVFVPAHGSRTFDVLMRIDPAQLPDWLLDGGPDGGTGALLQTVEFDGYIRLRDSRDDIHLAWQVLPHKSAVVRALDRSVTIEHGRFGSLVLRNFSRSKAGDFDIFALTGTSPRIPRADLPADGADFAVTDIASVGVRFVAGAYLQFAVNTFGRRAHPAYPAEFDVFIDTDLDGTPDYDVFTAENGGPGASGQTVVAVQQLVAGASAVPVFFADADLDSANMIMTVPLAAVGLTPTTKFRFDVVAFDNYFTGEATDVVEGMVFTPGKPRFVTDGIDTGTVAPFSGGAIDVEEVDGGATASPSQQGFLLMYRDAKVEAERISVKVVPKHRR
jgi:subtilisin family serine protease